MRWARYVARIVVRNAYKIQMGIPYEKRQEPKFILEKNIKKS